MAKVSLVCPMQKLNLSPFPRILMRHGMQLHTLCAGRKPWFDIGKANSNFNPVPKLLCDSLQITQPLQTSDLSIILNALHGTLLWAFKTVYM